MLYMHVCEETYLQYVTFSIIHQYYILQALFTNIVHTMVLLLKTNTIMILKLKTYVQMKDYHLHKHYKYKQLKYVVSVT